MKCKRRRAKIEDLPAKMCRYLHVPMPQKKKKTSRANAKKKLPQKHQRPHFVTHPKPPHQVSQRPHFVTLRKTPSVKKPLGYQNNSQFESPPSQFRANSNYPPSRVTVSDPMRSEDTFRSYESLTRARDRDYRRKSLPFETDFSLLKTDINFFTTNRKPYKFSNFKSV